MPLHLAPLSARFRSCGCAYVAVYGTLRAGGANDIHRLMPKIACIGHTRLHGTLYDLGNYPGLVLDGRHAVLAEVYPLEPRLEQALDGIEGLWPTDLGEYAKRVLPTTVHPMGVGPTTTLPVLVYEACPALVHSAPELDTTDWLTWYSHSGRTRPTHFALRSTTT